MKMYDSNLSSLFSSLNNQNSINYSDYALIKKGSYQQLMKAYYSEDVNATSGSSKVYTPKPSVRDIVTGKAQSTAKKAPTTDDTGLTQLKTDAKTLKDTADKLASEEMWQPVQGKIDTEKVSSAVKDFVNNYNTALEQAAKVNSKPVSQTVNWMTSLTGTMSKTLAKAGITVGVDNKLSLNEDALKNASMTTVKSLFEGKFSYGSQIGEKAESLSKASVMSTGLYNSYGQAQSTLSSLFDFGI